MNEYEHFEHHFSLKIESSHHQIKNFIRIFINNISKICNQFHQFWDRQHIDHFIQLMINKLRISFFAIARSDLFIIINKKISIFAIKKIQIQTMLCLRAKLNFDILCSSWCLYKIDWKLFCKHLITKRMIQSEYIEMINIHSHEHYKRSNWDDTESNLKLNYSIVREWAMRALRLNT